MRRRTCLALAGSALAGCASRPGGESTAAGGGESPTVERVVTGFEHPWAVAVLPSGGLLVTERPGRLSVVDPAGEVTRVRNTPAVVAKGQGGLLDVALGPSFSDEPWVYLTYAVGRDGATSTRVGRGRLDPAAAEPHLEGFEALYTAEPFVDSTGHFGSRALVRDEALFVTVGDRQFKNFGPDHVAQDPGNDLGTTLRLRPDGSVPADNPFVGGGGRDAVFSYGHRNQQGLAVHPDTGAVWASEFGESDGDEINRLRAGANYGWPVADEGCTYGSGEPIGVSHDERSDVVAPAFSWPCGSGGPAPSGVAFYDGAHEPWRGDLFVCGLVSQSLVRLRVDGTAVRAADPLLAGRGWRVRDVAAGREALYAVVDAGDAPLVRVTP